MKLSITVLNKIFILKAYHSMEKPSVLYKTTYYSSEQNIYPDGLWFNGKISHWIVNLLNYFTYEITKERPNYFKQLHTILELNAYFNNRFYKCFT